MCWPTSTVTSRTMGRETRRARFDRVLRRRQARNFEQPASLVVVARTAPVALARTSPALRNGPVGASHYPSLDRREIALRGQRQREQTQYQPQAVHPSILGSPWGVVDNLNRLRPASRAGFA